MKYRDYNDNELIYYVSENNEDAKEIIYEKYKPFIEKAALKMINYNNCNGIEFADLKQEGLVGLSQAINTYNEKKETSFYTYAKVCIERQMISLLRKNKTLGNKILNESISFQNNSENDFIKESILIDETKNPENIFFSSEKTNDIILKAKEVLTNLEMQVFELKINNFNSDEIASLLDKDVKSIYNTLTRIRVKLKKELKVA